MSGIAIRVEGLGKQYRIGARQEGYKTFRESLMGAIQSPFRRLGALLGGNNGRGQDPQDIIWALKDISFEVKQGEVVGIIGRNGAGKSTLLKVLSRITEPTSGRVEIQGRVGSLLEVGTGFHPELTGRENIFLNGAILGMRKTEILRKFDEIVAFSEVEKFIDTPVKRYSSGMYLRLAFSVAAHLDPEILLVDEVLAVGDNAFQKKCLGKMSNVAKQGRTVLFVSHNMVAVQNLCNRGVLLTNGILDGIGDISTIIDKYNNESDQDDLKLLTDTSTISRSKGNSYFIKKVWMESNKKKMYSFPFSMDFDILFEFSCSEAMNNPNYYFQIENYAGVKIFSVCNEYLRKSVSPTKHGFAKCTILNNNLKPGIYFISVGILNGLTEWVELIERCHMFEIDNYDFFNSGVSLLNNEAVILLESMVESYNLS
jgi:lipopolysaccharide transport system ATP-binding protein